MSKITGMRTRIITKDDRYDDHDNYVNDDVDDDYYDDDVDDDDVDDEDDEGDMSGEMNREDDNNDSFQRFMIFPTWTIINGRDVFALL